MNSFLKGSLICLFLLLFPVSVSAEESKNIDNLDVITGFECQMPILENMYIAYEQKPAKEELVEAMPKQIMVYLNGEEEPIAIDVSWYDVTEDYDTSNTYYYQFSPQWDENAYVLDDSTEIPYVAVFFYTSENGVSESAATKYANETAVFEFLRKNFDFNTATICGILANIQKESSFNPTCTYNDTGNTVSYGLCQWNSGAGRYKQLRDWCSANGYDYQSIEGQLSFMKYELETVSYYRLNELENDIPNTAQGAYDAALLWAKYYEGCSSRYHTERANLAKNTYWPAYSHLANDVSEVFTDVPLGAWYHDAVEYVYEKGIMTGMDSDTFGPANNLARAQFAVILHRMAEQPDAEFTNRFSDIGSGIWYTDAIMWASEHEIIAGYEDGRFAPSHFITREQIAAMLYRYAGYKGYDITNTTDLTSFADDELVSDYAKTAMQWAVANGIIKGTNAGTELNPRGNANRAECATIIMRFLNIFDN